MKRIENILKPNNKAINDCVVGARFSDASIGQECHIITYYVDEETIVHTIEELLVVKQFIISELDGKVTYANFQDKDRKLKYKNYPPLSMTKLRNIIVECSVIDSFSVPSITHIPERDSFLVTFYKTELTLSLLLERLGIEAHSYTSYGSDTISVNRELYNVLNEKIKTVMSENNDSQKMANDILSIVSGKKISSLLDLSPCLDALNSENLVLSEDHPTQKVFKNLEPLTDFIQNGVSKDNKDFDNKWIRFKYAMQRIPKNMTVVNVLQKIKLKENDIWNFNFPELPGNLYANDFCKDICSRIQTEVNSMPQDNQKLFETFYLSIRFL